MDRRVLFLIAVLTVMFLLILFNLQINTVEVKMKVDCVNQYNINDSCPCIKTRGFEEVNWSNMTLINGTVG